VLVTEERVKKRVESGVNQVQSKSVPTLINFIGLLEESSNAAKFDSCCATNQAGSWNRANISGHAQYL